MTEQLLAETLKIKTNDRLIVYEYSSTYTDTYMQLFFTISQAIVFTGTTEVNDFELLSMR